MVDDITRRVARYEHALIVIGAMRDGPLTEADHERAEQIAAMVERYEAGLRSPVKAREEPEAPAPRRRYRRRKRAKASAPAAPRPRGRPRKTPQTPAAEG